MKAVLFRSFGDTGVLELGEVEVPEPAAGEVRIRVHAAAVNHLDIWIRKGVGNPRLEFPHVGGADIAGTIEKTGPGVESVHVGDEVIVIPGVSCGICQRCLSGNDNLCRTYEILGEHRWGGFAEYVVVPVPNVVRRPRSLSLSESAAFPLTFLTAWQMVVEKLKVGPGDDVLVMAAGSGLSTAAIQIAVLFGGRVIAASSSEEKLRYARALGAEETVLYSDQQWYENVREVTGGKGADKVVDHTGADFWEGVIRATAWGGCIAVAGASSGYVASTPLSHIFYRQLTIFGSTMGSKSYMHDIVRFIEKGRLRPVVDRVLPLGQAAEAQRLLETRQVRGKVILTVRNDGNEPGR